MSVATLKMQRVFRLGTTDLPDPDASLSPEQVLSHYAALYPTLRHGKVEESGAEGDCVVFSLRAAEYKANG